MQYAPELESLTTFPEWKPLPGYEQAACRNEKPEKFYPTTNTGISAAKMVCFWCPLGENGGVDGKLAGSCLEYELAMDPTQHSEGIWGGATPPERTRIQQGTLTRADLYTECPCGEPIPAAFGKKYCTQSCLDKARYQAAKERNAA